MLPEQTRSVVIVDDDQVVIHFALKEIEKINLFSDVYSFTNSREALDFLRERFAATNQMAEPTKPLDQSRSIDLLLLDFMMPYFNGIEFMEHLRAYHLDPFITKVAVMLTIPLMLEDEDRFREMDQAIAFLDKPIDGSDLVAAMRA